MANDFEVTQWISGNDCIVYNGDGEFTKDPVITTTDADGTWYVSTDSVPSSAFSYTFPRSEWLTDTQWLKHVDEKDHMVELEELFEI